MTLTPPPCDPQEPRPTFAGRVMDKWRALPNLISWRPYWRALHREWWDEWRGSQSGEVVMRIKHLLRWQGFKFDLHQFVGADATQCYHTHPAKCFRLILWGGYVEELEDGTRHRWGPCHAGFIRPNHSHRVASLVSGTSYSLWIRGQQTHEVELRGVGWA